MRRAHLRSRVFAMTAIYGIVLLAITFGLSWRAMRAEERWSRLLHMETGTIARLEELQRAQNSFRNRVAAGLARHELSSDDVLRYSVVKQLLATGDVPAETARPIAGAMRRFEEWLAAAVPPGPDAAELGVRSAEVNRAVQTVIDSQKASINRQIPALERGARTAMTTGLAVVWMVAIFSFAAARLTVAKVVRPLEELSRSAARIAEGDLATRVPAGGDHEIFQLGEAFNRMAEALAASRDELERRARTDDLTALPNFRAFREKIEEEIERAKRYPEDFGVLVLDLDRFKQFNDRFGHLAGNEALKSVARVIHETVRSVDFPARYGGEEFAVIVPRIKRESLLMIAERVRTNVEAMPPIPDTARLTLSIGAALFPKDGATAEALFAKADERLYQAKRDGRNRVVAPAA